MVTAAPAGYREAMIATLETFGASDVGTLVNAAAEGFHHPDVAPIVSYGDRLVLEMFHGPTLSFKDHALQLLSRLMTRRLDETGISATVLVATSGDTGSAAIEAFRSLPAIRIVVVYPEGRISDFQRLQMTTVPDSNVEVVAVTGDFDDCQRLVKEALADPGAKGLVSANSINWGRLAAQAGYYLYAAEAVPGGVDVVIPTGNFGNAYSAWLARLMGAPIGQIAIATNANRALHDLAVTGSLASTPVIPTLAPAMDIQVPSNLARYLFTRGEAAFAEDFVTGSVDDAAILETMEEVHRETGKLIDPHTATAWRLASGLPSPERETLVVATAHPAKFASTVAAATGIVPVTPSHARVPRHAAERQTLIPADYERLRSIVAG